LILIYLFITAAAFAVVTAFTTSIIEKELVDQRVSEQIRTVVDLSIEAAPERAEQDSAALYALALEKGRELSGRVLFQNRAGVVQTDSFSVLNGRKIETKEILEVLSGEKDTSYGFHRIEDSDGTYFWSVYYTSAIIRDSETIGAVVVSQSIQDVADHAGRIRLRFLYVFLIATVVILIAAYFGTRPISKPIEELKEGAMNIAGGNFKTRVNIKGDTELSDLGNAFNRMTMQLESVDKQRSEFVSNASHELKTPLTSMKILAESLLYQDGVEEAVYQDFLQDIDHEINRLTHLINDLLLLTKLEDVEEIPNAAEANIAEMVEQVAKMLQPIAAQKNIEIETHLSGNVYIECAPVMLRQAINNLVDNAIKYSHENERVDIRLYTSRHNVYIEVEDSGEGIAQEHIDHIFERFYRVDKARSRETGGNGLGLHIVLKVVSIHGGHVDITSVPGQGSVFSIILPIRKETHLIWEETNE